MCIVIRSKINKNDFSNNIYLFVKTNIPIAQINQDMFVQMMIESQKSKYNKTKRKCCVHEK